MNGCGKRGCGRKRRDKRGCGRKGCDKIRCGKIGGSRE